MAEAAGACGLLAAEILAQYGHQLLGVAEPGRVRVGAEFRAPGDRRQEVGRGQRQEDQTVRGRRQGEQDGAQDADHDGGDAHGDAVDA